MMQPGFYAELRAAAADVFDNSLDEVARYIKHQGSPLRAICTEYDEQCTYNVRMESENEWEKRDKQSPTYRLLVKNAWAKLTHDQVVSAIHAGRFGPQTLCRRTLYREFSLSRFFPAEFGIDAAPAHDWDWDYAVGQFSSAGTLTDRLFELLEAYWLDVDEHDTGVWDQSGTASGDGESYRYIRRHSDTAFTDAMRMAMRDNEIKVASIPHTNDFIGFISIVESDFAPELLVFGDSNRFSTS